MPEMITSAKNEKLRNVLLLQKKKKAREEQGLFVIEGLRIFEDALRSAPERIEHIYLSGSFSESPAWLNLCGKMSGRADGSAVSEKTVSRLLHNNDIITTVSDEVFGKISETVTPQGILCVMRMKNCEYAELDKSRLLLLENIQDPGNLGTMVRTAEAAGITGIIMSGDTADIYSPKVTRSTMGSIFRMSFLYSGDFCGTIDKLKEDGVTVYGAYLKNGRPYAGIKYRSPFAILIGNEGNGISDAAIERVSERVFIPMHGEIESLNAAIAASVLMYRASEDTFDPEG